MAKMRNGREDLGINMGINMGKVCDKHAQKYCNKTHRFMYDYALINIKPCYSKRKTFISRGKKYLSHCQKIKGAEGRG